MQIEKSDDTVTNTISLGELFKDVMISLYKRRFSNIEYEEIDNFEFQIDQLISNIKKDFEHYLQPLAAAIQLGNEQFVIWNQLDDDLTDQILSLNNMDAFLSENCQVEKVFSVEITKEQIEANKLIVPYQTLYNQSIMAYENGCYELAATGFLAIADGLFAEKIVNKKMVNFFQRARMLVDKIEHKQSITNWDMDTAVLGITLLKTAQSLSQRVEFDKDEPHELNRNWIMHGRSRRKRTKLDCLKLIRLIYGVILIDDFSERKVKSSG